MFTVDERERLREELVEAARADERITGVALTGSASIGQEDQWSDIDLAFGVHVDRLEATIADWTARMYRDNAAIHHLDVRAHSSLYRVFLLPGTLQVDLAFTPAPDFGARAPTFRLLCGTAHDLPSPKPTAATQYVGMIWLYALHARTSIARRRLLQAEHMITGIRNQACALACRRHQLPSADGRGLDGLPRETTSAIAGSLVRSIDITELRRAFGAVLAFAAREIAYAEPALWDRLADPFENFALSTE